MYPRLQLNPGREKALLRGHPWLFSGALARREGKLKPGEVVLAVGRSGQPLALGFYHPETDIAFRVLTTKTDAVIDRDFFRRRIREASALRKRLLPPETTTCRLINAEGDGLPGLIVDRYGDYLVLSLSTAGSELIRADLIEILLEELRPLGIYERSEGKSRLLEGLEERIGPVFGAPPPVVEISEGGLTFQVDLASGQKTGFFLDQRTNRELVRRFSSGALVLNCFSYTGAFSVYAGAGGATEVVSVETSASANRLAGINWQINGLPEDRHRIVAADVFDYLRQGEESFDLVILDPPAFAKSPKDLSRATRGYKEINRQGMRRLKGGGLLFTFSCSNFLAPDLFERIVLAAACEAGKRPLVLARLGPAADHPVLLGHPQGGYLKGLFLSLQAG